MNFSVLEKNELQKVLIKDVENVINSGCNSNETLLITLNENSIESFEELANNNVSVEYFDSFVRDIYKKVKAGKFEIISDFTAIQIIYSISQQEMTENKAFRNLCKSISFSRELYNLFGSFKANFVTKEELLKINSSTQLSEEDKNRFAIIIAVFDKYNKFLEDRKWLDYRDVVSSVISVIKSKEVLNNNLKSQYKRVFVYGAQDLSLIQKEFLHLISDDVKFYLDKNAFLQGYQGAINIENEDNVVLSTIERNKKIFERAMYIVEGTPFVSESVDDIKYVMFNDFKEEVDYIAKDILSELKNGTNASDLAIITRDNSLKQRIVEILKLYSIPVNAELYSEEYLLFKYRFNRIFEIFSILEKFDLKEFNFKNFLNLEHNSLVEKEELAEKLNLSIQSILLEILENKYAIRSFNSLQEKYKHTFLLETVLKNQDILSDEDKKSLFYKVNEINTLYQAYLEQDYAKIVVSVAQIFNSKDENYNKFIAKFLKKLNELIVLKSNLSDKKIDFDTLVEMTELVLEERQNNVETVNILTCFRASGREFKKIYMPSMIDKYFPKKSQGTYFVSAVANEYISDELNKTHFGVGRLIKSNKEELKDEERMFYVALNSARENVIISTHSYEGQKQVQPSAFFNQLVLSDELNLISFSDTKKEDVREISIENIEEVKTEPEEKVIKSDDTLYLSASSIQTFLQCPKKYYFRHVLGIKEKTTYSASYGIIVHAIFELMLKKYLDEFSKEKALELGEILFNISNDKEKALEVGFDIQLLEQISELSSLDLCEMKENFVDAIQSLGGDYFNEKPTEAICETKFRFSVPEFENVVFSGFVDLIAKYENGYRILDYKTGKDKTALKKLISDAGVEFLSNVGRSNECFSETKVKEYEYQVPLYYLACLNADELKDYKDEIYDMGYQYVRPDYKHGGSKSDFIEAETVKMYKDKILENIKKYVVDEIRNRTEFEACYNEFNCKHCSFSDICDIDKDSEEEDDD